MTDIGPGDWVECAPPAGYRGQIGTASLRIQGAYPNRGGVYQVRDVGTYLCDGGLVPGLRLVGCVVTYEGAPSDDCWFPARCFRPIYRPKADLIESLLQPIKEDA